MNIGGIIGMSAFMGWVIGFVMGRMHGPDITEDSADDGYDRQCFICTHVFTPPSNAEYQPCPECGSMDTSEL